MMLNAVCILHADYSSDTRMVSKFIRPNNCTQLLHVGGDFPLWLVPQLRNIKKWSYLKPSIPRFGLCFVSFCLCFGLCSVFVCLFTCDCKKDLVCVSLTYLLLKVTLPFLPRGCNVNLLQADTTVYHSRHRGLTRCPPSFEKNIVLNFSKLNCGFNPRRELTKIEPPSSSCIIISVLNGMSIIVFQNPLSTCLSTVLSTLDSTHSINL